MEIPMFLYKISFFSIACYVYLRLQVVNVHVTSSSSPNSQGWWPLPSTFLTTPKYLHLPVLQRKKNGNNAWYALKFLHQWRRRTIFLQLAIKGDYMSSLHWTFTTTKNLMIHRSSENSKNSVWNTLALNNWGAISARYIFSHFLVKRQTAWYKRRTY